VAHSGRGDHARSRKTLEGTLFRTALILSALLVPTLASAQEGEDGSNIPTDTAIGVGIGIIAPAGSFAPNTASARFRVADGFAIEPNVLFGIDTGNEVVEVPDDETVNATRGLQFRLGVDGRFRLAQRDNVELMGQGGISFGTTSDTSDPEGSDNNTTNTSTSFGVGWGIGVNWWVHRSFCLSADVRNPLFSVSGTKATAEGVDGSQRTSNLSVDIAFLPTARMMGHVVF